MSLNAKSQNVSKMPLFDGDEKNWTSWKRLFRSYLRRYSRGEFDLLDSATKRRNGIQSEVKKTEDLVVELYDSLVLACRGQAATVISTLPAEDDEDGEKAWMALLCKYEVHTRTRFVTMHHQLLNARLDMARPDEYFHKIDLLRKQLSEVSADRRLLSDEEMISFALFALPNDVAYLRSILEADPNLTYAGLKSHIRSHAEGVNRTTTASEEKALASTIRRFRGTCFKCGQRGHKANQCRNGSAQPSGKACNHCGRAGHDTKDCYSPGGAKHHANVVCTKTREYAFSSMAVDTSAPGTDANCWIVDSACTAHMTHELGDLSNPRRIGPIQVECGGGTLLDATQVGSVVLPTKDASGKNIIVTLHDVLFVPNLGKRLFSVKKFIRSRSDVHGSVSFSNGQHIVKTDEVEIALEEHGNLFVFPRAAREDSLASIARLWHRRLGHVNQATVNRVLETNPRLKKKKPPHHVCEECAETKSVRMSFPKSAERRTTRKLQLVHSDVWGPITPVSLGGARYAVIFVDDFTRVKKLYFMVRKSELPEKFQQFVAEIARPEDLKVERLRSDCGGEYKSAKMRALCQELGVRQEFSAPYSPAQNGVAERSWRTLGRMAKAMLKDAGLSKTFWAEAMSSACFIANRLPTNALGGDNPYHRWTRRMPRFDRLRVFGCPVFVHTMKGKKLDDNAVKCIFLGYDCQSPAYRIWNPKTRRVIFSLHVRFQEHSSATSSAAMEEKLHEVGGPSLRGGEESEQGSDDANESSADEADDPESETDSNLSDDVDSASALDEADDILYSGGEDEKESSLQGLPSPVESRYNLRPRQAAMAAICDEPTFREALAGAQALDWRQAMQEEYDALVANETWDAVPLPKGKNVIGSKWVLRIKRNSDGSVNKFKARFVAQGFSQVYGEDYFDTFSPVTRGTSIRCLVALAAQGGWKLHHMDVCSAFLNAEVKEEIYVRPPPGMEEELRGRVLHLRKSLYGLKQAPRNWNALLDSFLVSLDLKKSVADPCVYSKADQVILAVWVDDMILTGSDAKAILSLKSDLKQRFKMKDEGELKWCLGMRISYHKDRITIDQEQYIKNMLARFGMDECKAAPTPASLGVRLSKKDSPRTNQEALEMKSIPYRSGVGSLLYASIRTRPDIASAVRAVAKFNDNPGKKHWTAVKRIFRYLKGTISHGISFSRGGRGLLGYCDSDWANDPNDRRSVSGYVFLLAGGPISWKSKAQSSVALSSCEAEYMAAASAAQEAVHLRRLLSSIGQPMQGATTMMEDNQGCIDLARNPVHHSRSKHIDLRAHFIREKVAEGVIELKYVPTAEQLADILTKALGPTKFAQLRASLQIIDVQLSRGVGNPVASLII